MGFVYFEQFVCRLRSRSTSNQICFEVQLLSVVKIEYVQNDTCLPLALNSEGILKYFKKNFSSSFN